MAQIPIVDYLVLDDGEPHLVANACTGCGALFFDRRNGCGRCGGREFTRQRLGTEGVVRSFTIVNRAVGNIPGPFVSAIVDLEGGGQVKTGIVGCDPTPEDVGLGMKVRLTTFPAGTDSEGTEAICFGFEPQGDLR